MPRRKSLARSPERGSSRCRLFLSAKAVSVERVREALRWVFQWGGNRQLPYINFSLSFLMPGGIQVGSLSDKERKEALQQGFEELWVVNAKESVLHRHFEVMPCGLPAASRVSGSQLGRMTLLLQCY